MDDLHWVNARLVHMGKDVEELRGETEVPLRACLTGGGPVEGGSVVLYGSA